MGVENKFCKVCSNAARKAREDVSVPVDGEGQPDLEVPPHECNATYKGPSTGMESEILVKGLTSLLEKDGLFVKYIIGDGD
jgi:hypothetical protein